MNWHEHKKPYLYNLLHLKQGLYVISRYKPEQETNKVDIKFGMSTYNIFKRLKEGYQGCFSVKPIPGN